MSRPIKFPNQSGHPWRDAPHHWFWTILYSLLDEQEEIGWYQLHLGRYGLTWDRCQRQYLELKHQKRVSGEPKWIRHTIRETWSYHKTRWLARNEALHSPSNGKYTSTATRLALLTRIQALYTHEEKLLVQNRHQRMGDKIQCLNEAVDQNEHFIYEARITVNSNHPTQT